MGLTVISGKKRYFLFFIRVEAMIGGGDYSLIQFANELAKKNEVTVVCNRDISKFISNVQFSNIKVPQLPHWWRGVAKANSFLWRLFVLILSFGLNKNIPKEKYCVGYLRKSALESVTFARKQKMKSIVFHFETPNWVDEELGTDSSHATLWRTAEKAYKSCDLLIANSKLAAAKCAEWCGRESDAVVYPGIEKPLHTKAVERDDSVVCIGRMVSSKSMEDAIYVVSKMDYSPTLIMIGSGPQLEKLKRLAKKLKVNAYFVGQVSETAKWSYICSAKLMIFPSRFEGFGMPPGESLSAGTPVICRDLSITKEVYGDSVLYFRSIEEASHLADELLSDSERWANVSSKGLAYIENRFTWEQSSEVIENLVDNMEARS
ncbi:MAG: glycosyltransferase [Pseudomonadota bacterium]|nr:glycosyltransferase [Pseudomonadota bacterium]